MKTLLKVVLVLLVMGGAAYASIVLLAKEDSEGAPAAARSGRAQAALKSRGYEVKTEPVDWTVTAVGTITANEGVDLVSEQDRRLVSIHFEDGQRVKAGDLLFQLDIRDLESELKELHAQLDLAKLNSGRISNLLRSQASTESEADSLRSQVQVLEARIESVETEIDKASIRAPFDGRIGLRRVSPGALLSSSTVMASLQDDSRVKIDFKFPERYASYIKIGTPFRFRVETSPEWVESTVNAVEPKIEVATRSLIVRGVADNADGMFYPGAFVQVELTVVQRDAAIMIPAEALVPSLQGSTVFVMEDGKAAARPVVAGNRTADKVEILEGLDSGDVVLTSNLLRLKPGLPVEVTMQSSLE